MNSSVAVIGSSKKINVGTNGREHSVECPQCVIVPWESSVAAARAAPNGDVISRE